MQKKIDLKARVVDYFDVDTGDVEDEICRFLDKHMKVKFHSAIFNNRYYVFIRGPGDQSSNSIMVSSYRDKKPGENISISYQ